MASEIGPEYAAEQYAKGFYCRPDEADRSWEEYRHDEMECYRPVFKGMVDHGCEFLSVGQLCNSQGPVG